MKQLTIAITILLASSAQAITVDTNEYFAYAHGPYKDTVLVSHSPCPEKIDAKTWKKKQAPVTNGDKGAASVWKAAATTTGDRACWHDVSDAKYGRNIEYCLRSPDTGKVSDQMCALIGKDKFISTENLPKQAF